MSTIVTTEDIKEFYELVVDKPASKKGTIFFPYEYRPVADLVKTLYDAECEYLLYTMTHAELEYDTSGYLLVCIYDGDDSCVELDSTWGKASVC